MAKHLKIKHGPIYDWMRKLPGSSYTGGEEACRKVEELFAGDAFQIDSVVKFLSLEEEDLDALLSSPTKPEEHLPTGLREIVKRGWREQRPNLNKGRSQAS